MKRYQYFGLSVTTGEVERLAFMSDVTIGQVLDLISYECLPFNCDECKMKIFANC